MIQYETAVPRPRHTRPVAHRNPHMAAIQNPHRHPHTAAIQNPHRHPDYFPGAVHQRRYSLDQHGRGPEHPGTYCNSTRELAAQKRQRANAMRQQRLGVMLSPDAIDVALRTKSNPTPNTTSVWEEEYAVASHNVQPDISACVSETVSSIFSESSLSELPSSDLTFSFQGNQYHQYDESEYTTTNYTHKDSSDESSDDEGCHEGLWADSTCDDLRQTRDMDVSVVYPHYSTPQCSMRSSASLTSSHCISSIQQLHSFDSSLSPENHSFGKTFIKYSSTKGSSVARKESGYSSEPEVPVNSLASTSVSTSGFELSKRPPCIGKEASPKYEPDCPRSYLNVSPRCSPALSSKFAPRRTSAMEQMHMSMASDATDFMSKPLGRLPVTHQPGKTSRKSSIAKSLKKVGRTLKMMGTKDSQLKTLALL